MYLRWGNYSHGNGEVQLATTKNAQYTQAGIPWCMREVWNINGMLIGTSQSNLDTQLAALKAAYANDGRDIALVLDGGADSEIAMYTADCIGGTKVTQGVAFPDNSNAAYSTFIPYSVQVSGDVAVNDSRNIIRMFSEQVSRQGGGARFGHLETLYGDPVKQQLRNNSIYRYVQSGFAIGYTEYPAVPQPLWPFALTGIGNIVQLSPRRDGNDYVDYEVQWTYEFESITPLIGNPNRWL